jgi:hypothetical protein
MKLALTKRLANLEQAASIPPAVHFIWDEGDETDIDAEIASRIAAGSAKAGDVFHIVSWRPPAPRFPNGPLGGAGEADR